MSSEVGKYLLNREAIDPTCITTSNPSNATLIGSRNGTCNEEIQNARALNPLPPIYTGPQLDQVGVKYSNGFQPLEYDWADLAHDMDYFSGPGGFDVKAINSPNGIYFVLATAVVNSTHTVNALWFEDPLSTQWFEQTVSLSENYHRPAIAYDPTRGQWWLFKRSPYASDSIEMFASTDLVYWGYLGILSAYGREPTSTMEPVNTRMPVSVDYSSATDGFLLSYVSSTGEIPATAFNGVVGAGAASMVWIPADMNFSGPLFHRTTRFEMGWGRVFDPELGTAFRELSSYTTPVVSCAPQAVTRSETVSGVLWEERMNKCSVYFSEVTEVNRALQGWSLDVSWRYPAGSSPSPIGLNGFSYFVMNDANGYTRLPINTTHFPVGAATSSTGPGVGDYVATVAMVDTVTYPGTVRTSTLYGSNINYSAWQGVSNAPPEGPVWSTCAPGLAAVPGYPGWILFTCGPNPKSGHMRNHE